MKSRHCAATNARKFKQSAASIGLVVGSILLAGTLPAQAQTSGNTRPGKTVTDAKNVHATPAEVKSRASYSLGVSFGTQLHGYGVTPDSLEDARVMQGIRDALAGKAIASPADAQRIQELIVQARASVGAKNKAAAAKFLAENAKRPGVITTASGLEYKIIRQGTGQPPKPDDQVTVNYRGTLLDGSEFDSSYKRKQPLVTPLNGLIKGWREALLLMKPGSKFELYIPPELGYGANSQPPMPPDSLLKFEVELLSVKPVGAPAGGAAPGGAMSGSKHK